MLTLDVKLDAKTDPIRRVARVCGYCGVEMGATDGDIAMFVCLACKRIDMQSVQALATAIAAIPANHEISGSDITTFSEAESTRPPIDGALRIWLVCYDYFPQSDAETDEIDETEAEVIVWLTDDGTYHTASGDQYPRCAYGYCSHYLSRDGLCPEHGDAGSTCPDAQ